MRRGRFLLLCAVLVALALSASAWAGEAPRKVTPPASQLKGIKQVLGGYLVCHLVVWSGVGTVGLMLLAAALSPGRVGRAEQALRRGRWKVVLVGVASAVLLFAAAAFMAEAAKRGARPLGVVAFLLVAFLVWLAVHGLAAMAKIVGQRLMGDEEGRQSLWRHVGSGGLAIAGASLVPIFGWAFFLYLFCRGVGAATLALFSGEGGEPSPA